MKRTFLEDWKQLWVKKDEILIPLGQNFLVWDLPKACIAAKAHLFIYFAVALLWKYVSDVIMY